MFRTIFQSVRVRDLVWSVVAGTITLLAALTLTVVSAWLITRSWQMPPIMDITVAVTAVRALGISRAAFRYIDRLASHKVALAAAENARVRLWQRLSRSTEVAMWSRGALLSRLGDDIDMVADVIVRSVIPFLVAALTSIVAVGFTAALSLPIAAVLAAGLLLAGVAAPIIIYRGTIESRSSHRLALEAHTAAVDRVLTDAPRLRIHGTLPKYLSNAHDATLRIADTDRAGSRSIARGDALATFASMFASVATVGIASWLFSAGGSGVAGAARGAAHSPEWLTVLVLIPLSAFESVAVLPKAAVTLARAHEALAQLGSAETSGAASQSKCDSDTEGKRESEGRVDCAGRDGIAGVHIADGAGSPVLQARNLVTGYTRDGHSYPLQTWNFTVPYGARKEIIAPSGAGKTTLLKTLAGLIPPLSGSVIAGAEARFIAEDEHIFATTVRDNIAVGNANVSEKTINELVEALGLRPWLTSLPQGLGTVLSSGGDSLSGGQRRRLILARALVSTAPILLLDEPTEHLDDQADEVLKLLTSGSPLPGSLATRTVVVVRHPREVEQ